jgi:hypothetical protein
MVLFLKKCNNLLVLLEREETTILGGEKKQS